MSPQCRHIFVTNRVNNSHAVASKCIEELFPSVAGDDVDDVLVDEVGCNDDHIMPLLDVIVSRG